ncbi:MAG TPA: hypothetical protein VM345_11945 [Acidimicrobiales bacterium]|nr:hypothetical protein [Acidimicrobiales bacterium]
MIAPTQSLSWAEQLLATPEAATPVGRRAIAVLVRQALESAIRRYWETREPDMVRASGRAKFVALRMRSDPAVAAEAHQVWAALSDATHHHPYELTPPLESVAHWTARTRALVAAIEAEGSGGAAGAATTRA